MAVFHFAVLLIIATFLVSCHAASGKYELVVTVYESTSCTGQKYGSWTYESNSTCFTVVQPPVPTIYINISSLTGEVYGSVCDSCGSGAKCMGKYEEEVCYNVDTIIHSTKYPLGVNFEYYRVPKKSKTNCTDCMIHCKESYSKDDVQVNFDISVTDDITVTI
ncbi:hypothetical protein GpartN1_g6323.t1 [Galdieria partita]|uniref:Uncharacterized protein n=1 Tax=Galdieria partita TaxID=83374 RepID=A0A9C7Q3G8_9RHOD|nr:hypothetical protein GpartN1_g6323.t1 [Galdieria partita]